MQEVQERLRVESPQPAHRYKNKTQRVALSAHPDRVFDKRRPQSGLDIGLLFQNPPDQLFTETVDDEVAFGPRNYLRYDQTFHQGIWKFRRLPSGS